MAVPYKTWCVGKKGRPINLLHQFNLLYQFNKEIRYYHWRILIKLISMYKRPIETFWVLNILASDQQWAVILYYLLIEQNKNSSFQIEPGSNKFFNKLDGFHHPIFLPIPSLIKVVPRAALEKAFFSKYVSTQPK